MLATLALLLTGCNSTADISTTPIECAFGYARGADGLCYEVESDTGSPDTDTDTGGDSDTDTGISDTDTGGGETGDTDTGPAPVDADRDGHASDVDCDDADGTVHPGAVEACDGVDQDCDGAADEGLASTWYADADGDGYGDPATGIDACEAPAGTVENNDDCDDDNERTFPEAPDDQGDGRDNDCDGAVDEDYDACALAYGWASWWTTETQYVSGSPGSYVHPIEGTATVCALTCDAYWLTVEGVTEASSCAAFEALPYTLSGDVNACLTVADPGTSGRGRCEVYTSAGTYALEFVWNE